MQLAAIRIGIDLNLFKILSKAGRPLTNVSLAESTGAAPELLGTSLNVPIKQHFKTLKL